MKREEGRGEKGGEEGVVKGKENSELGIRKRNKKNLAKKSESLLRNWKGRMTEKEIKRKEELPKRRRQNKEKRQRE